MDQKSCETTDRSNTTAAAIEILLTHAGNVLVQAAQIGDGDKWGGSPCPRAHRALREAGRGLLAAAEDLIEALPEGRKKTGLNTKLTALKEEHRGGW